MLLWAAMPGTAVSGPDEPNATLTETTFHHDASGNLVSDGEYFYQHDAWGRVVSVHEIGTYDPVAGTGALGDLICQFSYGGLGRLTRKLSPFPGEPNEYRTEHYYYDGVRRVQEEWSDPINAFSPFTSEEESGMFPATWTEREYVHGPGYVDEYVCQIDGSGRLAFILQDANYNVLALADLNGKVIEQFLWSPYGELLARESYLSFGLNKIGHQGLFFDRFDVPVTQSGIALQTSGAPPDGLYYNRNRSYSPRLGRFGQADPNGSGQCTLPAAVFHGLSIVSRPDTFSFDAAYGDGGSRYQYLLSSPFGGVDPEGLEFTLAGLINNVFWGSTLGGLIGGVGGGLGAHFGEGNFIDGFAAGFAGGVIGGATGGLGAWLGAGLVVSGGIAGASGSFVTSVSSPDGVTWEQIGRDVLFGTFTGVITAGFGKFAPNVKGFTFDEVKQAGEEMFSLMASGTGVAVSEFMDAWWYHCGYL